MKNNVKGAIIALVDDEREGKQINRALLKNVLGIFVQICMDCMNAYEADFEAPMLEDTTAYYSNKASYQIEEDSCPEYMIKAEGC